MYLVVIVGLGKVEDYYLGTALNSVQIVIDNMLNEMLRNVRDYANWDAMYNYINTQDREWVKTNVTDWIPKNFNIDLILIVDAAGKILYQYGNFEEFQIGKDLTNDPLLKKAFDFREMQGFYSTSKGIALIANSQIMHTNESGPRNGTYLYGRLINKYTLEELKAVTGIEMSLINERGVIDSTTLGQIKRPKAPEDIYHELVTKKVQTSGIYKPDFQFAFIYNMLQDIKGNNIGMLELIRPMRSITIFKELYTRASVWVYILMILLVGITVVMITNFVLKPLGILEKTIEEIKRTKDMLKRVKVESEDEVGILAKDFNAMMDTLNKSQNELIRTHQDLVKVEKMSTAAELAMGAVHQINNPLSIAINRVQMLRRIISYKTPIPESDLEKDLKIIEEQTKRAVDLTNSLLQYAKPTALRFERCNINELLKDTINLTKAVLEAEKINILENLRPDLPMMQYCDIKQMQDVFMNIIINAQQAMPGAGTLEISTDYDEKEDEVCVNFKDNGCGIPSEDIKKLFTPFFSRKADRTGLGLAISYNIVKAHRGKIEVESEVGRGSMFTVRLPIRGGLK
jgi:signal transduction histidine kinase